MLSTFLNIGIILILMCALISGVFWVLLGYTWWKMEKNRVKKTHKK